MNNRICLDSYSTNREKITIVCSRSTYNSDNKHAIEAGKILEAFLIDQYNFEKDKDYKANYPNYDRVTIEVEGKANVILALHLVLTKKNIFSLDSMSLNSQSYHYWFSELGGYIIAALEDDKLPRIDVEKLSALTKQTLDTAYKELKDEPVASSSLNKKINEQVNGQHLKHPFYQLLLHIIEDYETRVNLYNSKGFIEKLGAKKPDEKVIDGLFRKYVHLIPTRYCQLEKQYPREYVIKTGFSSAKLNASKSAESSSSAINLNPGSRQ